MVLTAKPHSREVGKPMNGRKYPVGVIMCAQPEIGQDVLAFLCDRYQAVRVEEDVFPLLRGAGAVAQLATDFINANPRQGDHVTPLSMVADGLSLIAEHGVVVVIDHTACAGRGKVVDRLRQMGRSVESIADEDRAVRLAMHAVAELVDEQQRKLEVHGYVAECDPETKRVRNFRRVHIESEQDAALA